MGVGPIPPNDAYSAAESNSRFRPLGTRVIARGGTADDTTNVAADALSAAGGTLVFQAGVTYTLAYGYLTGLVLFPDNTWVEVEEGATIIAKANVATGSQIYRLFGFVSDTPTNIHFRGGGLIDGNRRGGNHGASENVCGIFGSDIDGFSCIGPRFKNFRAEAIYIGHSNGGPLPKRLRIFDCVIEDCGYPESGDTSTAQRMGVAITGGQDIAIDRNIFDTIKGYAIDLEGNRSGDTFDNVHIGSQNIYRACEQGFVNVVSPDTCTNIDVAKGVANGLYSTASTFVVPANTRRNQVIKRTAADLTLPPGDTAWHDLPSLSDFVLEGCRVGDLIEVSLSSAWDNAGTYRNLDVASIVSGAAVNYWGTDDATPLTGVNAWRGTSGTARPFGGSVARRLVASDLEANGKLTLRFRYKLNTATTTVLTASAPALQAIAKNLGQF